MPSERIQPPAIERIVIPRAPSALSQQLRKHGVLAGAEIQDGSIAQVQLIHDIRDPGEEAPIAEIEWRVVVPIIAQALGLDGQIFAFGNEDEAARRTVQEGPPRMQANAHARACLAQLAVPDHDWKLLLGAWRVELDVRVDPARVDAPVVDMELLGQTGFGWGST